MKMDRQITKKEQNKELRRKLIIVAAALALAGAGYALIASLAQPTLPASRLSLATADRGDIEMIITGSGAVEPAFHEVVNSPITSRIVYVYHRAGDVVEAGEPLIQLDLEAARTAYESENDKLEMLRLQLAQLRANNTTRLADLRKQAEVAQMKLRRLESELVNERYLDSIGSGTTEKVREVEFSVQSGRLELEQLRQQLANEIEVQRADERLKLLEIEIKQKELAGQRRTLGDAELRAPRRGTVTDISDVTGSNVSVGQQVATVADLRHFRVKAEFAESYASSIKAGSPVRVRVGRDTVAAFVATVAPTASAGTVGATIGLANDSAAFLHPGLKADVKVYTGLRSDVVRLPNGQYYNGPGTYSLYIYNAERSEAELRRVQLGQAGYDFVEVVDGVAPGEQLVVNDMKQYENKNKTHIRITQK